MEDKLPVMLVNAKQARNIPGRKSDVSDATWLAQLGAHGLLHASFIPPKPVRYLCDPSQVDGRPGQGAHRAAAGEVPRIVRDQAVSGGHRPDPGYRRERCWRRWSPGNVTPRCSPTWPNAPCATRFLRWSRHCRAGSPSTTRSWCRSTWRSWIPSRARSRRSPRIETVIAPFARARDLLVTIPGISQTVVDVIIAETGADMTFFPTAAHLAWPPGPGCARRGGVHD